MDSFDTLLEKGQYDLIIKATDKSTDAESLFYRAIALASTLKFKEALLVLENNNSLLEKNNMRLLIQLHIDVLILLQDFDQAFEKFAYYKDRPYVSQEVEELLKSLPKYIREKEKETYISNKKEYSDEQINKILKGGILEEIIAVLDVLKNKEITPFLDSLINLLKQHPNQAIRTFSLLLLVSNKINKDVQFKSNEGLLTLNPSKLNPPFEDENFKLCQDFLTKEEKNVTVANNAVQLLSSLLIMIYPKTIDCKDVCSLVAIKELSNKYIQQENDLTKSCKTYNLNYNDLNKKISIFEDILSKF